VKTSVSIKKNHEFRRLYSKGKSAANPWLVVYCRKTGRGTNRLGITVSAKLGKAVVRNKVRRRLREIYRLREDKLLRGIDLVVVARTRCTRSSYQEMERAFERACRELKLFAPEKGRGDGA